MLQVTTLSSLKSQPLSVVENYGGKTAGNIRLLNWAGESPVPYNVPNGFAIPPSRLGNYSPQNILTHLEHLTKGLRRPKVIMARSSALNEDTLPGANDTFQSLFDPADTKNSNKRFLTFVDRLLQSSPDMGVTVMPMVGHTTRIGKGRNAVIGHTNLSFYATTHSPFNPEQALLSFCHGLGHTAAFHSDQTIPIIALRELGPLAFVGNMTEEYGDGCIWLPRVQEHAQYRQQVMRVFDVAKQKIVEMDTSRVFKRLAEYHAIIGRDGDLDGLVFPFFLNKELIDQEDERVKAEIKKLQDGGMTGSYQYGPIGYAPFKSPSQIANAVSLVRFIGKHGPAQIEGAYIGPKGQLFLYQHLPLPNQETEVAPLKLENPDIVKEHAFGRINYKGPLVFAVVVGGKRTELVKELEKKYADTGYALLSPIHDEDIVAMTPNCKVRLSLWSQRMNNHVLTSLWLYHSRPENAGNFAMSSGFLSERIIDFYKSNTINGKAPDILTEDENVMVFSDVAIEANGTQMAIKVYPGQD
ncbi:hypothetical protein BVY03_01705 [bacterium K02(2017)]|nr:hypothetical protein BVY03_01705 [bacterium K02(2017)]